ncbi:MAG TPA: hypothetical protein P5140_05750 [Methanofastidiosum sp.]|nr:hypothetical protein [Methanofastidiosum sp.]
MEGLVVDECPKVVLLPSDLTHVEEHLLKQSALYAFFSELYRQAREQLSILTEQFENWKAVTRRVVAEDLEVQKGRRVTLEDINSEMRVRYEKEFQEWSNKIREATQVVDKLKNWLDALKMKHDSLNSLAYLVSKERSAEFIVYQRKVEELIAKAGLEKIEEIISKLEVAGENK